MVLVLVLLLGLAIFKLGRMGLYAWHAYRDVRTLVALARGGGGLQRLPQALPALQDLAGSLDGLEREVRPLDWMLRPLDGVTAYGSILAASPELLGAGALLAHLAVDEVRRAEPGLAQGMSLPEAWLAGVQGREAELAALAVQAEQAARMLAGIPVDGLHPALAGRLVQAQALAPLLAPGLRMAPALPRLLGMERPHTYLLLVQNNHELRASGGFISGVGLATVERGRLAALRFADSYQVDNHQVPHPPAPLPMQAYMDAPLIFLRDANWSPDFPTTARLATALYAWDQGIRADGVIATDLRAVELLAGAAGPVSIAGLDRTMGGENVIELLKEFWESPPRRDASVQDEQLGAWWSQRKDFMPLLAEALLAKLRAGQADYLAVAAALVQALDERSIQVWIDDPLATEELARLGWDGALRPGADGDFLALVDTNMGFNKVDAVLTRSLDHQVTWPDGPDRPALAVTSITYRHPIEVPDHVCDQTARYGDSYDEMTRRCYFDYVRLYVPGGSELVQVDGVAPDSVSSRRGEAGTRVFAGFFVLEPGRQHTVTFTYRLPSTLTRDGYRLTVQRQSGSGPLPVRWSVDGQAWQSE